MIIFLTLVGAQPPYRHNLPFLGWLIYKMHSNALRFLFRFVAFAFFLLFVPFLAIFFFFRYFVCIRAFWWMVLVGFDFTLSPFLYLSFSFISFLRWFTRIDHFIWPVIISHFIVCLYHGARTLYFISRKNCVIHVSLLSDMTIFFGFSLHIFAVYIYNDGHLTCWTHSIFMHLHESLVSRLKIYGKI